LQGINSLVDGLQLFGEIVRVLLEAFFALGVREMSSMVAMSAGATTRRLTHGSSLALL
jgi:hypothetical protein